jgi:16S rRNA (guanine527-N7)-methyltransferase
LDTKRDINELFARAIEGARLDIGGASIPLLIRHYKLLQKWNTTFNLTSLYNPSDIIDRLYIDSLLFSLSLPPDAPRIFDIGSGPGFPGIPLLIAQPQIELTIVEPRQRMHAFYSEIKFEFKGKPSFEAIHARCDEPGFIEAHKEQLPVVISKGFAPLSKALDQLKPLLQPDGIYITCLNPETRIDAGIPDGFTLESEITYTLPLSGKKTRHLIFRRDSGK